MKNYNILPNILELNSIVIIDELNNYKLDKYELITKIIKYYDKIGIFINYVLLSNETQYLNDGCNNIKIIDYTKNNDINNYFNNLLNKNNKLNLLIINTNLVNIDNYKKYFLYVYDKNINIELKFNEIINKKKKIFVNFMCKNIAYGGGNQFVLKMVQYLLEFENIEITYNLENDIDIYFLIDIRKDRNGEFKKYHFKEIVENRNKNKFGKIIYRINDCNITRTNKELEKMIIENINDIDYFVFNSGFIKEYYFDKYDEFKTKQYSIITNNANGNIFYPKISNTLNKKIKIVTHHWSDNLNKGYDIYYKLYKYCQDRNDIEFVFVGRSFNSNYKDHPYIYGPYYGEELANFLRECNIYITASIYDSSPMHVLEGLSCGLPMLYINHAGGGKEICEMSIDKIGESFTNMDNLLISLNKIINNYSFYYSNIIKNINLYNSNNCYSQFSKIFLC